MPERESVNLPDLLGAITNGDRQNLDVVQCALGVRPSNVPAGKPFEVVLLLQNASDMDVDVTAKVKLPDKDAKGKRNRFIIKTTQLVVGMRPAEVGYLTLPVSTTPRTAQGDYTLSMELNIKRMTKGKPNRVRDSEGGGRFVETELDDEAQELIWQLQQMIFSVERSGRSELTASFRVGEQTIGKAADLTPGWHSLWTMRDHVDETILAERVQPQLDELLPRISRDTVFFPLLDAVQTRFEQAGYPLRAGESVMITKAMTLVLEQGVPELEDGIVDRFPDWFTRTCRLLFDQPQAGRNVGHLFTKLVFDELMQDAIRLSLTMVGTVLNEDMGDEDRIEGIVEECMAYLGDGMDFAHAYFPLVMGGLIANTRVVMPQERPRETVWLVGTARQRRQSEVGDHNMHIFAMVDELIDRSLDQAG
jgi:hypothetical protein